jgi:nucleoside-diphosphate-sugar epimerase
LIVPNASGPQNDLDFRPDTLYGQSKVLGEQIVRESKELKCEWCIIRPTSIWGPWSDAPYNPYGRFFKMVAKGWYFHPGDIDPPRYFGYVGNTVFQIMRLLTAPAKAVRGKIFYLADYETYHIRDWANLISIKTNGHPVKVLPLPVISFAAKMGDILKMFGVKNPPMTSFRLRNMQADTTHVPLKPIQSLTGPLPYSIEKGVDETIVWLRSRNLIKS